MFKVDELLIATKGSLICGRENSKIKGISIDSRTIKPKEAFIAIKGNNFDGHDFIDEAIKKGATCIIKKKGAVYYTTHTKELAFIEVDDTQKALGDIARFWRTKFDIPVIAVTGSNGKTTTKEMIAWILSKRYRVLKNEGTKNNQIGVPLTLLNLHNGYDIAVLEIGTNHFGEIKYLTDICNPNVGIITNIGSCHLEYLYNLKGVLKEKYALIENLSRPYIGILNADDNLLKKKINIKNTKKVIFSFGVNNHADFFARGINTLDDKIEFLVNSKYRFTLNTLGYYNIYNALAAIAVAGLFGMQYKDIASKLSVFDFPQSRLRLLKLNKIKFIDDTYNSNPASLRQALEVLKNLTTGGRKIFVMGDMLELGKRQRLFHYQAGKDAAGICDVFITVGPLSVLAAEAARDSGLDMRNIFTCKSTRQARDILFNQISLKKNDIVLVKGSRLMKLEEVFKNR